MSHLKELLPNSYQNIVYTEKVATVPREVKMYRRALQMLQRRGDEGMGRMYHGVKPSDYESLLRSGVVDTNPGAHGYGAYFWDNIPRQVYMRSPDSLGISISKKDLGKIEYPNAYLTPDRKKSLDPYKKHMIVSKNPLDIPGTGDSYAVAPPEVLRKLREAIKGKRMRPMDTAIFNRAEADLAMKKALGAQLKETGGYTPKDLAEVVEGSVTPPSKKYLRDLLKRKVSPPEFPAGLREDLVLPPRDRSIARDNFTDAYDELINFGPHS